MLNKDMYTFLNLMLTRIRVKTHRASAKHGKVMGSMLDHSRPRTRYSAWCAVSLVPWYRPRCSAQTAS